MMKYVTLSAALLFLLFALAPNVSAVAATPNGMVVLFTDYGADSIYVGAIKGAIYAKFPQVRIDSITNSVPPYDIVAGAYMLAEASREFPEGTTFCCVVDPGVGTPRKRVVLETKNGYWFVGPDNGLLWLVAQRFGIAGIHEATKEDLWRKGDVSHTFQGRDIFGPVAAAVARGVALDQIGPEVKDLVKLDIEESRVENGAALGVVIRADDYGNLVTNISSEQLAQAGLKPGDTLDLAVGKAKFHAPWKATYADVPKGQKLCVIQSSGLLECAINKGSLAQAIGESFHARVSARKAK